MAVRRLVKAVEKTFFLRTSTFQKCFRMALGGLVKPMRKCFFSENDYFPKMCLEWL